MQLYVHIATKKEELERLTKENVGRSPFWPHMRKTMGPIWAKTKKSRPTDLLFLIDFIGGGVRTRTGDLEVMNLSL